VNKENTTIVVVNAEPHEVTHLKACVPTCEWIAAPMNWPLRIRDWAIPMEADVVLVAAMGTEDQIVLETCRELLRCERACERQLVLAVNRYQMQAVHAVQEFAHARYIIVPFEERDFLHVVRA